MLQDFTLFEVSLTVNFGGQVLQKQKFENALTTGKLDGKIPRLVQRAVTCRGRGDGEVAPSIHRIFIRR